MVAGAWLPALDGDRRAMALYERHYSARQYADGRDRKLFVGPGEKMVLLTERCDALFVWRRFIDASGQRGINCAVFRNEGGNGCRNSGHSHCSSRLIYEADLLAWEKWPDERRHYTYVDPKKVRSANKGYCFKRAGWHPCGASAGGLLIFAVGCSHPAETQEAK